MQDGGYIRTWVWNLRSQCTGFLIKMGFSWILSIFHWKPKSLMHIIYYIYVTRVLLVLPDQLFFGFWVVMDIHIEILFNWKIGSEVFPCR